MHAAVGRLRALEPSWVEVHPTARVRDLAQRMLRTHALLAQDSLQLAAALVASGEEPASLGMVCLDARLTTAAQREGFAVAP